MPALAAATFSPDHDARAGAPPSASSVRAPGEGDFAPLARLERVRRDPARAADPAEIDRLARDAEGMPPGLVRTEARMFVAEAYLGRLHRPADALPLLDAVAGDASADPLTARFALRMLVDARLETGDVDGAQAALRAHPEAADPSVVRDAAIRARRRTAHRLALALVAVALGGAGAAITRALRGGRGAEIGKALRRWGPIAAAFAVYVALGGALLASGYEAGSAAPFLALGVATLPIFLLARAWGAAGATHHSARAARATVCAAAVVAAGFLVLEWIDASFLKGFGF